MCLRWLNDGIAHACFAGAVAQDVFGHRGTADVAEADEKDFVGFHMRENER